MLEIDRGLVYMEIFCFLLTWLCLYMLYRSENWYKGKPALVSFIVAIVLMALVNLMMYAIIMKANSA